MDPRKGIISVRVGGSVFKTDKSLLLTYSEYFRALFQSGMMECQQEEICLKSLCARGFSIMLAVLGGKQPILDGDEIVEAIECAAFLQTEILTKHLLDLVNSDNCLLMYHTAATFGLLELYDEAALFIRSMYQDLQEEMRILPGDLVKHVESLAPSVFVAVGAHSTCTLDNLPHSSMRTVCYLDEEKNEWRTLTELPVEASTSMAGVAVLDNRLYVVGGVNGIHKQAVDSCFCYDVMTDSWRMLPSPQQPRYNFTLIGLGGRLYAIGGEYEKTVMSSVEMYDISAETWSFKSHLPRPVAGAACAKAMSRIFVCLWKPMNTTDIYEYVPITDEWQQVTTLIKHQSYGHCMVAHRDNLYIIRNGPQDDFLRCLIDCYNLTTGQWTAMPGHYANSKGALFTAVVRGDSVFTLNRTMTMIYTVTGNMWKPRNQMKGFPRSGSVWTFLLKVPKLRGEPNSNNLNGHTQ
ncbi:kelch repeat and BTB domain-containing protein 13 [Chanos chanos]|uniref:Kelch repeat and BTB domain-containing protein 13 n=1 Tax=Chanos chanos TaxID=29144 RepID=A0A6J2UMK1_CHACN|nr:kelch repeat and BTB domain-containing protein 13-like [Chanos chanos]